MLDPPAPSNVRRFTHPFSSSVGYAAARYSHKWSEALDADAFTRFKKEGVMSAGKWAWTSAKKILSRVPPKTLKYCFRDLRGRGPSTVSPSLERAGLRS